MNEIVTKQQADQRKALAFMDSMRGNLIMSQALHHSIAALKAIPAELREDSNIADMEYIRDNVYSAFSSDLFNGLLGETK
jgi:hypothetical protein